MARTDAEIREDLKIWEKQLDLHLEHCETCNEGSEVYCKVGCEISYMVTSLLMEQVRTGVASPASTQASAEAERQSKL